MKTFLKKNYSLFFLICYFIFIIGLGLMNAWRFSIVYSIGIIPIVVFMLFRKKIVLNKKWKLFLLLLIPIVLRIILLFLNYGNLESDYEFFYGSAVNYSKNLPLSNEYIAMFPYLYFYIVLLGNAFQFLGNSYVVVVFVNFLFEMFGVYFLYKTVKDKPFKNYILLLYLYNPFSIFWLTKCCPVTVVNALLMILFYVFTKIDVKNKYILYSIITGILMGITNNFRPVIIIFFIAIAIYYASLGIRKYPWKKILISFGIISLFFFGVNKLSLSYTKKQIQVDFSGNQSGWSIFVGSNIKSKGRWNREDSELFRKIVDEKGIDKAHKEVLSLAIERYQSYGINNIQFLARKSLALGSHLVNYTYEDVTFSILHQIPKWLEVLIKMYMYYYLLWILILNVKNAWYLLKYRKDMNEYGMFAIFGFGLFVATLLVEVHARYFMPVLIPLIYFAGANYKEKYQ
ncbi:MAG: hypothetical protein HFH08_02415 [Bacilli bacterium]|nr:hypothetical protein [Bacilli bacterium]